MYTLDYTIVDTTYTTDALLSSCHICFQLCFLYGNV